MKSEFLVLKNLHKSFGKSHIIQDFNLTLKQGSMTTLLGPSGCGKTTILRLIAGLEQPTSGQIFLENHEITSTPPQERDIGIVFQSYALFPHLTIGENVEYSLKMQGISQAERKARVKEALALVDLSGFEFRTVDQLSGGQQQRVALARALILKPKVLLFDEPLSNLDANLRRMMREKIRELQQQLQMTALYVTHDQAEAFAVSDEIVVMKEGKIIQQGSPATLYRHPKNAFMAKFMGEASLFEAHKVGDQVQIGQAVLTLPHYTPWSNFSGRCLLGIRPEAVKLTPHFAENGCQIRQAVYMGSHWEIIAEWQNQPLTIHAKLEDYQENRSQYGLQFNPQGIFLLEE